MFVLELLYKVRVHHLFIWYIDNNHLGFSIEKQYTFPDSLKKKIKLHKNEILEVLAFNDVLSLDQAKKIIIYRWPERAVPATLSQVQKGIFI